MPPASGGGRDTAVVEVGGDGPQAHSLRLQALDQRRDGRAGLRHALKARGRGGGDIRGWIAKLHPARLGLGQGGAGALGNHLALVLRHSGEDVQGQPVGARHVHGDEFNTAFHEIGDEGDVAGQPVELGDDQRGALPLTGGNGRVEFGPVGFPPTLDLGELGEDVTAPGRKVGNDAALGVEAKAAGSLAVGGNAVIGPFPTVVSPAAISG